MKLFIWSFLLIVFSMAMETHQQQQMLFAPSRVIADVELVNSSAPQEGPQKANIVGGNEASYDQHPYQLQLALDGALVCGAAVIGKEWAVTAAHCVDGESADKITLRAGAMHRNTGGRVHSVSKVIVHQRYDDEDDDYDIALLKVRNPFQFGRQVQKILLPTQGEDVLRKGSIAVASGWGYLEEDSDMLSDTLQYVKLAVFSRQQCQKIFRKLDLRITDRMFCAGSPRSRKDTCQGDSGGPIVSRGKLIGIVSWGVGCGRPGYPGVYTRINKLRYWIKEITRI